MAGFELGVWAFNYFLENNADLQKYICETETPTSEQIEQHKVKFINTGKPDSWFSKSFAIGDGILLAKTLLAQGADAILPVAGPQTKDCVGEIKRQGSKSIVVGVDTAQENSDVNDINTCG
jgi:basic membrane lipoprotein Med (substrate-binding protein (PBP1-ABC) superfamily)